MLTHWLKFQVPLTVIRGPLVDEVHQRVNPWISQVDFPSMVDFLHLQTFGI